MDTFELFCDIGWLQPWSPKGAECYKQRLHVFLSEKLDSALDHSETAKYFLMRDLTRPWNKQRLIARMDMPELPSPVPIFPHTFPVTAGSYTSKPREKGFIRNFNRLALRNTS